MSNAFDEERAHLEKILSRCVDERKPNVSMTTALPATCFLPVAGLVFADGQVRKGELEGFRRAAQVYGVSAGEITRLEQQAQAGIDWASFEIPELSEWQKALTYAFAVWVAKVDGIINRDETAMLKMLSDKLGLDKLRCDAARSATYDIAALPGGHKPELFDFKALEAKLETKLPASFKRHMESQLGAVELDELDELADELADE